MQDVRPRVLIIDQDANLQATWAMVLFQSGFDTATTRHFEEAYTTMIEHAFNVVIMDPFEGQRMLELLDIIRRDDLLGYPGVIIVSRQLSRARDAVNNGWAEMAFDKDAMDPEELPPAVEQVLAAPQ